MNLPCEVVMDLIPLCKDGVGSSASCRLVEEHIASCASCRAEYEATATVAVPDMAAPDEEQLLKKLRYHVLRLQGLVLVGGTVLGVSITFSHNVFYNFLLMPLVGALSFVVLRRRAYLAMVLVFALSLISNTIYGVISDGLRLITLWTVIASWIAYSTLYAFLVLIGWCIAWLLHYAFGSSNARDS